MPWSLPVSTSYGQCTVTWDFPTLPGPWLDTCKSWQKNLYYTPTIGTVSDNKIFVVIRFICLIQYLAQIHCNCSSSSFHTFTYLFMSSTNRPSYIQREGSKECFCFSPSPTIIFSFLGIWKKNQFEAKEVLSWIKICKWNPEDLTQTSKLSVFPIVFQC